MIRIVLIISAIITGSQITRTALAMPRTNHDPPGKFDRSNGALYTARHEDSSRNGFFKAPYFRVTLLFFLSLFLRRRSTCSAFAVFMFLAFIMISRKIVLASTLDLPASTNLARNSKSYFKHFNKLLTLIL